jgi:hypothetical protein
MHNPVIQQAATDTLKVILLHNQQLADSLKVFLTSNQEPWWQSALAQLLGVFVGGLISFIAVWYSLRKQLASEAQKWRSQKEADTARMDSQFKQQLEVLEKQHEVELHKIDLAHQNEIRKVEQQFSLELNKEFQFRRFDACQGLLRILGDTLSVNGIVGQYYPSTFASYQRLVDFKGRFFDYICENQVLVGWPTFLKGSELNQLLVEQIQTLQQLEEDIRDKETVALGQVLYVKFSHLSFELLKVVQESLQKFDLGFRFESDPPKST